MPQGRAENNPRPCQRACGRSSQLWRGPRALATVRARVEALREIAAVTSSEARRLLRSGRVVVLLALYALFTALVVLVVGTVIGAAQAQLEKQGVDASATAQLAQLRTGLIGAW